MWSTTTAKDRIVPLEGNWIRASAVDLIEDVHSGESVDDVSSTRPMTRIHLRGGQMVDLFETTPKSAAHALWSENESRGQDHVDG